MRASNRTENDKNMLVRASEMESENDARRKSEWAAVFVSDFYSDTGEKVLAHPRVLYRVE